jgi:hypothetical protein
MWKRLKLYLLKKLYRILVVKVYTIDRAVLNSYQKFHTFCDLSFQTNQGRFSFSFKEDRRSKIRDPVRFRRSVSSYLVELEGPDSLNDPLSPLLNKVIVVVMIHVKHVNCEVLANVLLDLYIDQFPSNPTKLAY